MKPSSNLSTNLRTLLMFFLQDEEVFLKKRIPLFACVLTSNL